MGAGIIPIVSGASGAVSSVKHALTATVNTLVGFVDPGKARDRDRENRAELWYQWALQGSLYAARIVLGAGNASPGTAEYTTKERGYYDVRLAKLQQANPQLVQQARIAGPLKLGGDENMRPTQAQIDTVSAEIEAAQHASAVSAASPYGAPEAPALLTPSAQAPAMVQMLPPVVTTANAPSLATVAAAPQGGVSGKFLLGLGAALLVIVAVVGIMEHRK